MRSPHPRFNSSRSFITNPWVYFIVLALLNTGLSYISLPPAIRTYIFFLIVLTLLARFLWTTPQSSLKDKTPWEMEFLPSIPPWVWFSVIGPGLFLRFYKLETLSTWPNLDEGRVSLFALEQDFHWSGKLLYGYNQLPPLFYWLYAIFFKIFNPSLFSLWLFPAVISTFILFLALVTGRLFFSKSFSFLLTALMALSFWPLYSGRFAAQGLLVLFWELLVLMVLGLFLKAPSLVFSYIYAGTLGILVGSGFYVHLHWPVIALMVSLAFGGISRRKKSGFPAPAYLIVTYLLPCLLVPVPLALAILRSPSFGDYMRSLLSFQPASHGPFNGLTPFFSSLSALFWGVHLDYFAYKPFWGGFLNPVMGALFFLGLGDLWKNRRRGMSLWILAAFPIFLIPCFLTNNVETFRMIQILPLLLVTAGLGLQVLLKTLAINMKILFLVGLLPLSLGLDVFHLNVAYASFWTSHPDQWSENYKTYPFYRAFQTLDPLRKGQGPGVLLFSTLVAPDDQTLAVTTYPFNAVWNPLNGDDNIHWGAFFQWEDADSYLSRRFPLSKSVDLGLWPENLLQGLQWIHEMRLRLVPLDSSNQALFTRWIRADQCLQESALMDLNRPDRENHSAIVQMLLDHRALFEKDPYLESLFWETVAGYEKADEPGTAAIAALRNAAHFGFPRASSFHRLGVLLVKNHDYPKAQEAFLQAYRLNPLFKPPKDLLHRLTGKKN